MERRTPLLEELAIRARRLAEREAELAEREGALCRRQAALARRARDLGATLPGADEALAAFAEALAEREAAVARRRAAAERWAGSLADWDGRLAQAETALGAAGDVEGLRRALIAVLGAELEDLDARELRSVVGRALATVGLAPAPEARPLERSEPTLAGRGGVRQEADLLARWPEDTIPPEPATLPARDESPPRHPFADDADLTSLPPGFFEPLAADAPALPPPVEPPADAPPSLPGGFVLFVEPSAAPVEDPLAEPAEELQSADLSPLPSDFPDLRAALMTPPARRTPPPAPLPPLPSDFPDPLADEDEALPPLPSDFPDPLAALESPAEADEGDLTSWSDDASWKPEAEPDLPVPPEAPAHEAESVVPFASDEDPDERSALESISPELFAAIRAEDDAPPAASAEDPFADLAAELDAMEPVGSDPLQPIPGYDAQTATTPEPAPEPRVDPPFGRTLGRVSAVTAPDPLGPAPVRREGSAAVRFAVLAGAAETDDPWRSLEIGDLRRTGHPGPLPAVNTVPPPEAPPPAPVERGPRRAPRAHLAVKVGLEHGNSFFTGFSRNISGGGLFVATHQILPIGSEVDLFFEMPDGHPVNVRGEVRWLRADNPLTPDVMPGMGIAFLDLQHDDEVLIDRYVAAHDSLFYEP